MGDPLRILIVEDSPDDVQLLLLHLKRGGFDLNYRVVDTAAEMRLHVAAEPWDCIISDYSLPGFDAFGALELYKQAALDIPFIIVSGTIEQDTAIAAMKAGAHDYLMKDNLGRLAPAIRRELLESENRESRRRAETELANVKEQLAIQLSEMTWLHELSVRLSTAQDLDSVTQAILSAVTSLQKTDAGALILFDNHRRKLTVAAALGTGEPDREPWPEVPATGLSHRTVIERRSGELEIGTSSGSVIFEEFVRKSGYKTARSMPLLTRGGTLLGAIEIYLRGDPGLSDGELRLMELYLHQAGQYLDNMILYKQAQDANRLKDEFVAMVSHELRTPLTPIMGAVHMLRTNPADANLVVRALEVVERNVRTQSQIIEDLLDISRIVSGKLRLQLSPVDLKSVVTAALSTIRSAAEAKQISIELDLQVIRGVVLGDFDRLQQIVWNLLSNSVKFTSRSGKIRVSLRSVDGQAEIAVTDSGIGISSEFLPFVFDRFRQADSSSTRAHGGLGLGLSIVRQLVELHGGIVMAESAGAGKGSSFIVRLPERDAIAAAPGLARNGRKLE